MTYPRLTPTPLTTSSVELRVYRVQFYKSGTRVQKEPMLIEADSFENAEEVVKHLLGTMQASVPDKFDDWCLIKC